MILEYNFYTRTGADSGAEGRRGGISSDLPGHRTRFTRKLAVSVGSVTFVLVDEARWVLLI